MLESLQQENKLVLQETYRKILKATHLRHIEHCYDSLRKPAYRESRNEA